MVNIDDVVRILRNSPTPLTVADIALEAGAHVRTCDALLWDNPEHFVWQPGHKWALARTRSHVRRADLPVAPDVRSQDAASSPQSPLRALTLSSGLIVKVGRRPLDTDAFFVVRSVGNQIMLTLNSGHEVFADLPLPFENSSEDDPYKSLCEVLLTAWALYEDGIPEGATRRSAQDARLFWGRRVVEMVRESGNDRSG